MRYIVLLSLCSSALADNVTSNDADTSNDDALIYAVVVLVSPVAGYFVIYKPLVRYLEKAHKKNNATPPPRPRAYARANKHPGLFSFRQPRADAGADASAKTDNPNPNPPLLHIKL